MLDISDFFQKFQHLRLDHIRFWK